MVFRSALAEAYTQYARGVQAAKSAESTIETVTVYARTLAELQEFVKANGRLPKWNSTDTNELMLHSRTNQGVACPICSGLSVRNRNIKSIKIFY